MNKYFAGVPWLQTHRMLRLAALALPLCGCAITTVGADGSREVFGWVHMKVPASLPASAQAGETIDLTVVGLLVFSSPVGGGLAFGYSNEHITALKNNVQVFGAPRCASGTTDRVREGSK